MIFALLPRNKVLYSTDIRNGDRAHHNKVCDALDDLEHAQYKSFQKDIPVVFTENEHKYCIAGIQPNRASTGVSAQTYHFLSMTTDHQETIIDHLQQCDNMMKKFIPNDEVAVLYEARNGLNFRTMFANGYQEWLYGSIASGINVHQKIHDDLNFCDSITTLLIRTKKSNKEMGKRFRISISLDWVLQYHFGQVICYFLMQPIHMQTVQFATRN